jgi:hypothetical protein
MPNVPPGSLYRGTPHLITEGLRHSIGWQDSRAAGPSFVVTRQRWPDRTEVQERFPLTERGWDSAWRAVSGLDPGAAAKIAAILAERDAIARARTAVAALDDESICSLWRVTFASGSGNVTVSQGESYDLRFLSDRVMVSRSFMATAAVEIPYRDVETLEAGGPGRVGMPDAGLAALILGAALVGAVLGLLIVVPRLTGLLLGALLFGFLAALAGLARARTEAVVRVRSTEADLSFTCTGKRPDELRMELSAPRAAIASARAARARELDDQAEPESRSIPDQLTKLATLLDQGLISRDEFDQVKATLLAQS